jgi:hypothetical protein
MHRATLEENDVGNDRNKTLEPDIKILPIEAPNTGGSNPPLYHIKKLK